jgi:hypothetical protein
VPPFAGQALAGFMRDGCVDESRFNEVVVAAIGADASIMPGHALHGMRTSHATIGP